MDFVKQQKYQFTVLTSDVGTQGIRRLTITDGVPHADGFELARTLIPFGKDHIDDEVIIHLTEEEIDRLYLYLDDRSQEKARAEDNG